MNERIDPRTVPGNPAYQPAIADGTSNRPTKQAYCTECQDSTRHMVREPKGDVPGSKVCAECLRASPFDDDSVMRRVASSMAGRRDRDAVVAKVAPKLEFEPIESNGQGFDRAKVPGGWLLVGDGVQPLYIPDPGHTWK